MNSNKSMERSQSSDQNKKFKFCRSNSFSSDKGEKKVEEVKKVLRKQIQEESARSDYVDENFEIDETDELWGVSFGPCHQMNAKQNSTKVIDEQTQFMNKNWLLRFQKNYQYKDPS